MPVSADAVSTVDPLAFSCRHVDERHANESGLASPSSKVLDLMSENGSGLCRTIDAAEHVPGKPSAEVFGAIADRFEEFQAEAVQTSPHVDPTRLLVGLRPRRNSLSGTVQ